MSSNNFNGKNRNLHEKYAGAWFESNSPHPSELPTPPKSFFMRTTTMDITPTFCQTFVHSSELNDITSLSNLFD